MNHAGPGPMNPWSGRANRGRADRQRRSARPRARIGQICRSRQPDPVAGRWGFGHRARDEAELQLAATSGRHDRKEEGADRQAPVPVWRSDSGHLAPRCTGCRGSRCERHLSATSRPAVAPCRFTSRDVAELLEQGGSGGTCDRGAGLRWRGGGDHPGSGRSTRATSLGWKAVIAGPGPRDPRFRNRLRSRGMVALDVIHAGLALGARSALTRDLVQ